MFENLDLYISTNKWMLLNLIYVCEPDLCVLKKQEVDISNLIYVCEPLCVCVVFRKMGSNHAEIFIEI